MKPNNIVSRITKRMFKDSHPSMQPEGTVPFVLNGVVSNDEHSEYGYSNEKSTELFCTLSEGFVIRGYKIISERDSFIVFSCNTELSQSEIGLVNIKTQEYTILLNDKNLDCKLDFNLREWIDSIEVKRLQSNCPEMVVYWSNSGIYRRLNIDANLCDLTCKDLNLISLDCIPKIEVVPIKSGGLGLLSGSYQFMAQLVDKDNNTSNIFGLTRPKSIGSANNIAGEISEEYIQVKIKGIKTTFTKIRLYVIKKIEGKITAKMLTTITYNSNGIIYNYRSDPTESEDVDPEELLAPITRSIRGKRLVQKNGRLILYDIIPEWNVDYQRKANNIKVYPVVFRVPVSEAHKYTSMMRNEIYALSIEGNFEDGTKTACFHIPGREADDYDRERIPKGEPGNCTQCDQPRWKIEDTATPFWSHPDFVDPYVESDGSVKHYKYTPQSDPYYDPEKEFKVYKDKHETDDKDVEVDITDISTKITNTSFPDCLDCKPDINTDDPSNPSPDACHIVDCLGFLDFISPLGSPDALIQAMFCKNWCVNGKITAPSPCMGCPCNCPTITDDPGDTNDDFNPPPCIGICNDGLGGFGQHTHRIPCKPYCTCDSHLGLTGNCVTMCHNCEDCPEGVCRQGICKRKDSTVPIYCEGCACTSSSSIDNNLSVEQDQDNVDLSEPLKTFTPEEVMSNLVASYSIFSNYSGNVECTEEQWKAQIEDGIVPSAFNSLSITNTSPLSSSTPTSSNCGYSGGCGGGTSGGTGGGALTAETVITQGSVLDSTIPEQPIFDAEGCNIIGYKPVKLQEWKTAYWESEETYPLTKACDGSFIYGDLAGARIRHHKMPSTERCPHFVSYQTGVPNIKELGNLETDKGYVHLLGLKICNIPPFEDLPKNLCKHNPFTIKYTKRDYNNRSVEAKGLVTGTFKGELYGEAFFIPKNGVNSLELFDRHIERNAGTDQDHSGENNIYPAYNFHSPDTSFSKVPLFARKIKIEMELWGKGFRHGLYSLGKEIESKIPRINQKGARQAIHLNKMSVPLKQIHENQVVRCLKEISYLPGDKVLPKGPKFSMPWMNLFRESSVALEFEPGQKELRLSHSIDPYLSDGSYNGTGHDSNANPPTTNGCNGNADCEAGYVCVNGVCTLNDAIGVNQTCDGSFIGDVFSHEGVIHLGAAHYGTLVQDNPSQYGRLELQQYIDIGLYATSDDMLCGHIEGTCGDTYINQFSFERTCYVSNRVGTSVIKSFDPDYKGLQKSHGGAWPLTAIKKWFIRLLVSWGIYDVAFSVIHCGEPPASRDPSDPRNGYNSGVPDGSALRYNLDDGWDGDNPFDGFQDPQNVRRGYYPAVQKTLITYFVESDTNIHFRETGKDDDQSELGEVAYPKLKNLTLDSSFNQNNTWEKSYLNRFYAELKEVDFYKKIMIFVIVTFVKLVLPILLLVQLGNYIKSGGDLWVFIAVTLIQVLMLLIFIIAGLVIYTILSYLVDRYLVVLFQIRQCKNDEQGGPGDALIKGWQDNYAKYNFDHSSVSDLSVGYGMGDPYNTCKCEGTVTNEILFSNQQVLKSPIDAYRNFKVNAYLEISEEYGNINSIFVLGSNVFVHTTDMLWNVHVGVSELKMDNASILLGRPDFINNPSELYGGIAEGYLGCLDPNAAITTPFGRITPDREAKKIFQFSGNSNDVISFQGLDRFFNKNMGFDLLTQFPGFKTVDQKSPIGIGYSLAVDNKMQRYLFTKRDYRAIHPEKLVLVDGYYFKDKKTGNIIHLTDKRYFIDVSFTLSYDPNHRAKENSSGWISFHSYTPDIYMYDRFNLYSVKGNKIYVHDNIDPNNPGTYQEFYGEYYPFIVEVNSRDNTMGGFQTDFISLDTEASKKVPFGYVKGINETFNKAMFYNSNQSTPIFNLDNPLSLLKSSGIVDLREDITEKDSSISISRIKREWRISNLRNHTVDSMSPILLEDGVVLTKPNPTNLSDPTGEYLYDKYLTTRLILDDERLKDINLILKTLVIGSKEDIQ